MKKIELVGGGGLAGDIIACFGKEVEIAGIWDDGLVPNTLFYQLPVLGPVEAIPARHSTPLVIAVGNPTTRKKIFDSLCLRSVEWATLIHSSVQCFDPSTIQILEGVIIMPNSYLTHQIVVGCNTLVHIGVGLHHEVHLGAHNVLMPGSRITCAFQTEACFLLNTNQSITTNKITV